MKSVFALTLLLATANAQTHQYRDLFAEQGHTSTETRAKIDAAYRQLFHGDKQTQTVFYEAGANADGPLAYLSDVGNHDVRTEGISYGMMIAVQMNRKPEFDALWNWASTYMLITDPENPSCGYFAWSMSTDGTPRSDSPAPDGEEYMVTALYFADHRWGSGKGIYDYHAQADRILALMRHHPVVTRTGPFRIHPGDAPFTPPWLKDHPEAAGRPVTVGPMVNEHFHMIKFVPNTDGFAADTTDPSYHLPAFYELWALWGPKDDRAFWAEAAKVSRTFLLQVAGPKTGLTPERDHFDGSPSVWRGQPVEFGYDAWRSVSNWSVDFSWWHKDPDETALSDRIQGFLLSQGITSFVDRYTLDGKPLSHQHPIGLLATTAVGSLAATPGPTSRAFVDELWKTPVPSGGGRYYDGMLYLMSMLHVSGNFRIW